MSLLNRFCKSNAFVLAAVIGLFIAAPLAFADPIAVDIEGGQPLTEALNDFANQVDKQILFASDLVNGRTAPRVQGRYEPEAALNLLLEGSGLNYSKSSEDTYLITPAALDDTQKPSPQDRDSASGNRNRYDEAEDDESDEDDVADLGRITVTASTGTNIRGLENPTTPVLQFDREDIDLSGAATVEDFLRTVPQNFGGAAPIASDSANPNGGLTGNALQRTAVDLRGLGAGSTLTLLNGRRMTATGTGSFVDVSILPLGVIDRIDIQTDGASAVYGTDAVGGVVNFITRRDFDGFEVNGRYGRVTDGSREEYTVGAAGGLSWQSGGGFFGFEYLDMEPLLVSERDFVDTTIANPEGTFGASSEKISAIASVNQDLTDRLLFSVDALYSNNDFAISQNTALQRNFRGSQESRFINSRLSYNVTDSIDAELFADFAREDLTSSDSLDNFERDLTSTNELLAVEGLVSGSIWKLSAGELAFAVGAAYREENLSTISDENFTRKVAALYGELLVPVIGENQAVPLIRELTLSVAGRYEDYSDFGDTFNPKIGTYWEIIEGLSFRASYSESFKAPTQFSLDDNRVGLQVRALPATFYTAGVEPLPVQDPRVPDGAFILAFTGGSNPLLQEETATTWNVGLDWEPPFVPGLSIQTSYFSVEYSDRIEGVLLFDPLREPEFADFWDVPPNLNEIIALFSASQAGGGFQNLTGFDVAPEDVQVLANSGLQNLAERNVKGVDLGARYSRDFGWGEFSTGLNLSYLFDFEVLPTELSEGVDQVSTSYRPIDLQFRGNVSWSIEGFKFFAAVNFDNDYQSVPDDSVAVDIDSWTTVDLGLTYDTGNRFDNFLSNTRFGINLRNVFDEDPPFFEQPLDGLNFDPTNADPFGRVISFTASKQF